MPNKYRWQKRKSWYALLVWTILLSVNAMESKQQEMCKLIYKVWSQNVIAKYMVMDMCIFSWTDNQLSSFIYDYYISCFPLSLNLTIGGWSLSLFIPNHYKTQLCRGTYGNYSIFSVFQCFCINGIFAEIVAFVSRWTWWKVSFPFK